MKLALLATVLLSACAAPNFTQLSPAQISAMAKEKTTTVQCTNFDYLMARVTMVFISVDMGKFDGTVVATSDCTSTVSVAK